MARLKEPILCVDVSEHNGKVDWNALQEQGVKAAIIRAGYGTDGVDNRFKENAEECIKRGIPFGFYHYCYTGWEAEGITDEAERQQYLLQQCLDESKHFYELIKPYEMKCTLPCFFDIEDKVILALNDDELFNVCYNMWNYFGSRNIMTGFYASKNVLENRLNHVVNPQYGAINGLTHIWVADWGANDGKPYADKSNYKYYYAMWQYTSNYFLNGKRFDMNYIYQDFEQELENGGLNGALYKGIDLYLDVKGWHKHNERNGLLKMNGTVTPYWHYVDEDGSLRKGWLAGNNEWYFMNPANGMMVTGMATIGSDSYFFDCKNGNMLKSRWVKAGTSSITGQPVITFYLPDGKRVKNMYKYQIDGSWWFFAPDGTRGNNSDSLVNVPIDEEYPDNIVTTDKEIYEPYVYTEEPIDIDEKPIEKEKFKVCVREVGDVPSYIERYKDSEAVEGEPILFELHYPEGYHYDMRVLESDVEATLNETKDEFRFTMPAHDVHVIADWERKKYTVSTINIGDVPKGIEDSTTSIKYNDKSVIFYEPLDGYKFTATSNDLSDLSYNNSTESFSFTMPAKDATIVVKWEKAEEEKPIEPEEPEDEDGILASLIKELVNIIKKIFSIVFKK